MTWSHWLRTSPPLAYKLIVDRSAILKMADWPKIHLYAPPPGPDPPPPPGPDPPPQSVRAHPPFTKLSIDPVPCTPCGASFLFFFRPRPFSSSKKHLHVVSLHFCTGVHRAQLQCTAFLSRQRTHFVRRVEELEQKLDESESHRRELARKEMDGRVELAKQKVRLCEFDDYPSAFFRGGGGGWPNGRQ